MARVCEHSVEGARDATQVKCVCQQCAVANLAPGPRAHEPPQLGMALPCRLSGLVLKAAERLELALHSKQLLDRGSAKRAIAPLRTTILQAASVVSGGRGPKVSSIVGIRTDHRSFQVIGDLGSSASIRGARAIRLWDRKQNDAPWSRLSVSRRDARG